MEKELSLDDMMNGPDSLNACKARLGKLLLDATNVWIEDEYKSGTELFTMIQAAESAGLAIMTATIETLCLGTKANPGSILLLIKKIHNQKIDELVRGYETTANRSFEGKNG